MPSLPSWALDWSLEFKVSEQHDSPDMCRDYRIMMHPSRARAPWSSSGKKLCLEGVDLDTVGAVGQAHDDQNIFIQPHDPKSGASRADFALGRKCTS
jgi:hypothetical protein